MKIDKPGKCFICGKECLQFWYWHEECRKRYIQENQQVRMIPLPDVIPKPQENPFEHHHEKDEDFDEEYYDEEE